jgi:hypothetical protein
MHYMQAQLRGKMLLLLHLPAACQHLISLQG